MLFFLSIRDQWQPCICWINRVSSAVTQIYEIVLVFRDNLCTNIKSQKIANIYSWHDTVRKLWRKKINLSFRVAEQEAFFILIEAFHLFGNRLLSNINSFFDFFFKKKNTHFFRAFMSEFCLWTFSDCIWTKVRYCVCE